LQVFEVATEVASRRATRGGVAQEYNTNGDLTDIELWLVIARQRVAK
jgi:hypothetical protein